MKKAVTAAAVAALVAAPAAVAGPGPNANANTRATAQTCNNLEARMGKRNFNALFAPRTQSARAADRSCARREAAAQQQARANAAQLCKRWAAGEDTAGFQQFFPGTTSAARFSGRNAHGKCVSTVARMQNDARRAAMVNAAKACAPGRTNARYIVPALAGTSKAGQMYANAFGSDKNAYGKCVSFVAKAKQTQTATP
jgi:hypothetical protein